MESCDLLQSRSEVGARGLKSSFKGALWRLLTFEGPHIRACNSISAPQHLHYIQNNKRAQRHFPTWSLNIFSHDTIGYLFQLNIDPSYEQDLLLLFAVLTKEKCKWKPIYFICERSKRTFWSSSFYLLSSSLRVLQAHLFLPKPDSHKCIISCVPVHLGAVILNKNYFEAANFDNLLPRLKNVKCWRWQSWNWMMKKTVITAGFAQNMKQADRNPGVIVDLCFDFQLKDAIQSCWAQNNQLFRASVRFTKG